MTIEEFVIEYLNNSIDVPASGDVPSPPPERFITVEQTGSGLNDFIKRASIAVQSWAPSRAAAMALNEQIKSAMALMVSRPEISRCHLESDYNHPDLTTKTPRYQAIFQIVYFL